VNPDADPDPIRIQGFDEQKLKEKKYSRKIVLSFFLLKIAIYLCHGFRRSLQPSEEKIQHFKKLN
jgi:hypothetical protein